MRKTKEIFILFFILLSMLIPFSYTNAHSIELDPEKLISLPWLISNGEGTISIDDSQTGYLLYYQAVEIPNSDFIKMEEIKNNGENALDALDAELEKLDAECDNLKDIYNDAFDAWETKVDDEVSEEEIEAVKTAYETAKTNYQNKVTEYNTKVEEYRTKTDEIEKNINALIPIYIENNWIKTEDGQFKVDLSEFSGDKSFAVWVKLVASDGATYYEEVTYTMSGTKVEVESITLDKSTINLTKGSNYTLVATINPTDASDKLIKWSSDNEKVATVEDGKVTAISEGVATITVETEDGQHKATCKVTVTKKAEMPPKDNGKEEPKQDSTVANGRLPQTGEMSYIIILAISILSIIGIIMYKKHKYLNFK